MPMRSPIAGVICSHGCGLVLGNAGAMANHEAAHLMPPSPVAVRKRAQRTRERATREFPTAVAGRQEWREEAACRDKPTRLFFDVAPEAAKQVCEGCPVRAECLEFAIVTNQGYGVWAGLTEEERRRERKRRQRAARRMA